MSIGSRFSSSSGEVSSEVKEDDETEEVEETEEDDEAEEIEETEEIEEIEEAEEVEETEEDGKAAEGDVTEEYVKAEEEEEDVREDADRPPRLEPLRDPPPDEVDGEEDDSDSVSLSGLSESTEK